MLRTTLKWIGIGLGCLVGLVVVVLVGLYAWTGLRLGRIYRIEPAPLRVSADLAGVERGRHWTAVHCTGCHGEDLAGTVVFDDPSLGRAEASNLTSGRGGVASAYTDADWVRAIRHGVRPNGKALVIMPSKDYYYLSDDDLAAIIAYVKAVPPVDKQIGGYAFTPMARILAALGAFGDFLAAEVIDHGASRPSAPTAGASATYGAYLVKTGGCQSCHGQELSGGKDPNPAAPPAPNITPAALGGWSETEFVTVMRTGVMPGGRQLSEFMPWKYTGRMSDDELKALWLYLKSVPAKESAPP